MLRQIVCLLAAVLCFLYYGSLCLKFHKWNSTFSRFWIAAGILFLAAGRAVREEDLCVPVLSLLMIMLVIFGITEVKIIWGIFKGSSQECSCLVVLGAHVEGKKVTDSLKKRLDQAVCFYRKNPGIQIIVSGGRGKGEDITEAEAMKHYLVERGVPRESILCEEASTTTKENLLYSRELMPDRDGTVGIVTNNFHMYRSVEIAKRLGYTKIVPIPAGCDPVLFANYMVREFFAVWKMWLLG